MKLKRKQTGSLMLAALVLLTSVLIVYAEGVWRDGSYEGDGYGYIGPIRVQVDIAGGIMTGIDILETNETNMDPPMDFWDLAHPEMVNRILEAQSTDVDTVSGATYASQGIIDAVNQALRKAEGGEEEEDFSLEMDVLALNNSNDNPADDPVGSMLLGTALVERIDGQLYATIKFGAGSYWIYSLNGSNVTRVQALAPNGSTYLSSLSNELNEATGVQSFRIPITTLEGQVIRVDFDVAIIGLRTARLFFSDLTEKAVDKSALEDLVGEASLLEEADFSSWSWESFRSALDSANGILADDEATQTAVDGAYQILSQTIDDLVPYREDAHYRIRYTVHNTWNDNESVWSPIFAPTAEIEVTDSRITFITHIVPAFCEEFEADASMIESANIIEPGGIVLPALLSEYDPASGTRLLQFSTASLDESVTLELSSPMFSGGSLQFTILAGEQLDEQEANHWELDALVYKADLTRSYFYTEQSYASLRQALQTARDLSAHADQPAVDSAASALHQALTALELNGDPLTVSTLDELCDAAKAAPDGAVIHLGDSMAATEAVSLITRHNITIDGQGHTLDGGGLTRLFFVQGGMLTLKNTTIRNARYLYDGQYTGMGSAVYALLGDLRMENCTVLGSMSSFGNVHIGGGRNAEIIHCTFAGNNATGGASLYMGYGATGILAHTIMVGGASISEVYFADTPALVDGGYNLITSVNSRSGSFPAETTVIDGGYYSGYTQWLTPAAEYDLTEGVLPLLEVADSPARDKIPADHPYLADTDQQGTIRPQNGRGDIGAHELIPTAAAAKSVVINAAAMVTMNTRQAMQLTASLLPENAAGQSLSWASSNPSVATVDETGLVTAVQRGTAVISVTTATGLTDSVVLRVTA